MNSINSVPKFGFDDYQHIATQEIARGEVLNLAQYLYKDPMHGETLFYRYKLEAGVRFLLFEGRNSVVENCKHDAMPVEPQAFGRMNGHVLNGFSNGHSNGVWEVAGRCHLPHGDVDCVSSLPILRRLLKYDCLVLVKQYRPSLKAFTLELPTGLVDPDEKISETGLRETKEETGYIGTVIKHTSPVTALDPALSNATMKLITVEIDGDRPENLHPEQSRTDHERADVVHIPVSELLPKLNDYSKQGIIVDSRVYSFAVGMAMGAKFASSNQ